MERIQLNPNRIVWCCTDFGITLDMLASETGVSSASINRAINESAGLTYNQLRKIADYFGQGVLFFLEKEPIDQSQLHSAEFRTLANQKPELSPKLRKLIERAEQQRNFYTYLIEELKFTDHPIFTPPNLANITIPEAAKITRQWLNLGSINNFNSYRLAVERQGILAFRTNGYNGKWQIAKDSPILGFTLYDTKCPVIVIKKSFETHQSFTLMHELGHLLLHKSSSIDDEQDFQSHQGRERDANAFAGHILVPNDFLQKINDADKPYEVSRYDEWLDQYIKDWGVSCEVILRRLLDSNRLDKDLYTAYRNWRTSSVIATYDGGSRMYRHREPTHVFGTTFVRTVLDALNARQITLSKASQHLDNIKISDLHQLERHFANV